MTSAALAERIPRTPPRGWAALLLMQLQISSLRLYSFALGVFLPFIAADLALTPLQAGLLQAVWWITAALAVLPFGVWFSRWRPARLVLASMLLTTPFLLMHGLAANFLTLFAARFFAALFHALGLSARPMLFRQWAARSQYALINSVGLSQHSALLAVAVSSSALLITALGGWRAAYFIQGGFLALQIIAWLLIARESKATAPDIAASLQARSANSPLAALRKYPQGWLVAIVMFALAAVWTGIVTFLPTLLLEERGIPIALGGALLGFLYYALIPGALAGGWLNRKLRNRRLLLGIPAALNALLALAITLAPAPLPLAALITALGLVWVAVPAMEMLPFEFPCILPREVAAVSALITTLMGLGFAAGPLLVGAAAQLGGGLQTGLIAMSALASVGVVAALVYPVTQPGANQKRNPDAANPDMGKADIANADTASADTEKTDNG